MSVRSVRPPSLPEADQSRVSAHTLHCVIFTVNAKLSFKVEAGREWPYLEALD
jgi:hypothetical protein